MSRRQVRASEIQIDGQRYAVHYFEHETLWGGRRFSGEVTLRDSDRIIVDDDSLAGVESKVERLAPATIYSRLLASRHSAAA